MESWNILQPDIDWIVPKGCDDGLGALLPAERTVFLVWCYSGIVNNGGHDAFYTESIGDFAVETVEALRQIGADECARDLLRCNALFEGGVVPKDTEERRVAYSRLPDEAFEIMELVDNRFFPATDGVFDKLLLYWIGEKDRTE